MDINLIIFVVVALATITTLYKVLPHRQMSENKPSISLLPKFKARIKLPSEILESEYPEKELEISLSKYGFIKKSKIGLTTKYSRGHILGDFSIKIAKVNLLVTEPESGYIKISIEAGWVAAFDTGDFWTFLKELKDKLENKTEISTTKQH